MALCPEVRGPGPASGGSLSEPVSISTGIAQRYAAALFDLAREAGALAALDADAGALGQALAASADLRDLIASPVYSREDQAAATAAVAAKMGLHALTANTLALMAAKRRLFVLPQLVVQVQALIAAERGEVTAEVATPVALSEAQARALAAALAASVGKNVMLNVTVDESLIGGLVVRVGSKMIDTSVKARLAQLQNAMKEVG